MYVLRVKCEIVKKVDATVLRKREILEIGVESRTSGEV